MRSQSNDLFKRIRITVSGKDYLVTKNQEKRLMNLPYKKALTYAEKQLEEITDTDPIYLPSAAGRRHG